ncbi:MAG: hypothetical protein ACOCTH_00030 [Halodesulfurarchaeum sp.]
MRLPHVDEWRRETCSAERARHHRALADNFEAIPLVEHVERPGPLDTEHGHSLSIVIAQSTRWGTCPNAVLYKVVQTGLPISHIDANAERRFLVTLRSRRFEEPGAAGFSMLHPSRRAFGRKGDNLMRVISKNAVFLHDFRGESPVLHSSTVASCRR